MKAVKSSRRNCLGIMVLAALQCSTDGQGIPEPSLIIYGKISDTTSGLPIQQGAVAWQIAGAGESVATSATVVNVNGQWFCIARVLYGTRPVAGVTFSRTSNTVSLTTTAAAYPRTASVGGKDARIVPASLGTFSFGAADRGRIERVDLEVAGGGKEAFAQWLARHGLPANTDPNADPDKQGTTYMEQFVGGIDPTRADSIFRLVEVSPEAQGLTVVWANVSDHSYTIERSTDLGASFVR